MAAPLNSILEVGFEGTVNGQRTLTVLHYRVTTVSPDPSILGEQETFIAEVGPLGNFNIVAPYIACCGNNFTLNNVTAQFVSPTRTRRSSATFNTPGQVAEAVTAQNVSAVITKRTDLGGRKQIGGVHLPAVPPSRYVGGMLTAAHLTAMATLRAALLATVSPPIAGGSYKPCLWHKKLPAQPASDLVTQLVSQETLRIMRRRTVGLGI